MELTQQQKLLVSRSKSIETFLKKEQQTKAGLHRFKKLSEEFEEGLLHLFATVGISRIRVYAEADSFTLNTVKLSWDSFRELVLNNNLVGVTTCLN
jgi:hypothetical protein